MPLYITGKWWGKKDITPVVGLHGFEDNAGTFDRLAPLLDVPGFLALDAPGHGKSSHFPRGMVYHFPDFVFTLRRLVLNAGWQKISIVGHSFGSAMGHIYSSLYPLDVEKFVSLDCARTVMATTGSRGATGLALLRKISQNSLKADGDVSKVPPAYSAEHILDAFCKATLGSVSKEHAQPLLQRGITAHPSKPDHFYFTRDPKLRYAEFNRPNLEILEESAQNIKCHVITILGTEGFVKMMADLVPGKAFFRMEELIKNSAASYRRFDVEGSHHVHLNNPERVAPLINKFLAP